MSAASPKMQDKAGEKAPEPSMEEILASIRRIIADDQAAKPAEMSEPEDDVLDLAEVAEPVVRPQAQGPRPVAVEAPKPAPLDLDEIDFQDAGMAFDEPETAEPEPEPFVPEPVVAARPAPRPVPQPTFQAPPRPEPEPEVLVSPETDASVSGAFNLLAHTVLSQNARTLEDLVKDMLKPMLKTWLDDNLPVVVERLVRAEIERVARGR